MNDQLLTKLFASTLKCVELKTKLGTFKVIIGEVNFLRKFIRYFTVETYAKYSTIIISAYAERDMEKLEEIQRDEKIFEKLSFDDFIDFQPLANSRQLN